ncbi:unnamed protein product [Bemisia tabaci]|uniref:Tudor domain-containing protein 5 n=2 Tax=Bemisia tabaci TaxID=7038 RepID=A0A9P0F661_BEMTA|nr:unnamed protein product [Bemisia tabaci]
MGLSDLKITVKSILTSSQKPLTPRELLRDFKEIEGYDFPYQKLGFSDFLQCLQSQDMSDAVKVQYSGGVQVLVPVLSEKSKHIDELVMKQKSKQPRIRSKRPSMSRRIGGPPRARPPRLSTRPPRFDSKPFSSSSNYQSSSYRPSSYSSSSVYSRPAAAPSSSVYSSNKAYSSSTVRSTYSSGNSGPLTSSYQSGQRPQPAGRPLPEERAFSKGSTCQSSSLNSTGKSESFSSSTRNSPSAPSFLKEKVVEFMKTRQQGVREDDFYNYLLTRSFRECGIKTVPDLLKSCSDIIVQRNGLYYMKQASNGSSQSTSSTKQPSPVPGGYEDEAFEDDDEEFEYYSDEDQDTGQFNGDVACSKVPSTSSSSNGPKNHINLQNCKSQISADSCGSDSGCYDAANEKMGNRMRHNFQSLLDDHPYGINLTSLGNLYKEKFGYSFDFQDIGFSSMIEFVANHPTIFFCYRLDEHDDFIVFDATKEIPVQYKLQTRNQGKNQKVPPDIHENMKQLLRSRKSSGLLSSELEECYQKKYRTELNLSSLGFDSANSFLTALSDLCYLRPVGKNLRAYSRTLSQDSDSDSPEPDHFHIPLVLTQLFPPECCDNSCKIPPQKICREDTHPADDGSKLFIEIVISEVYSPTRFYFNLRSKVPSLNAMMDDLEAFYNEDEKHYCMPPTTIAIGQVCAAKYAGDNRWHRVKIVSIPTLREVTVYYMDYGTSKKIAKTDLRFLHKDFEEMCAQAIRGRLFNLKPASGKTWEVDANHLFFDLTDDVPLMAEIKEIKTSKNDELEIDMVLYDTNGEEDVIINKTLVDRGLATFKDPPLTQVSDVTRDFNALTVEESGGRELAASSISSDDPHAASQTANRSQIPPGFPRIKTPEPLLDGTNIAKKQWSSENQQCGMSNSEVTSGSPNVYDSNKEVLTNLIQRKEVTTAIADSIFRFLKSEEKMKPPSPCVSSDTSDTSALNQDIQGSSSYLNQSTLGQNITIPQINQQQYPGYANPLPFPAQLSNISSLHNLQQPAINYIPQHQPSMNFMQSPFIPNNLQNMYTPTSPHSLPPPGFASPTFVANQFSHLSNRPPPVYQVPNTVLNPYQTAQPTNQQYPSFQSSNIQNLNSPNLNVCLPNVPYLSLPRSNLCQNFPMPQGNEPLSTSNPLVNAAQSSHNHPLVQNSERASASDFASTTVQVPELEQAISPIRELNRTVSSIPENPATCGAPSMISEDASKKQRTITHSNHQTSTPLPGESPSSKKVEEIMNPAVTDIYKKIAEELVQKALKQSSIMSDSNQTSKTVNNTEESKDPQDVGNLLHSLFPQLESKDKSKLKESIKLEVNTAAEDDRLSSEEIKEPQINQISSTSTEDLDNLKPIAHPSKSPSTKPVGISLPRRPSKKTTKPAVASEDCNRNSSVATTSPSSVDRNKKIIEQIVVSDKMLHLLMIDGTPHIITDEFVKLYTPFSTRQSIVRFLELQYVELPFLDYDISKLPANLPPEVQSTLTIFQQFDKIDILPLKYVPELLQYIRKLRNDVVDDALIGAFNVSLEQFGLSG